MSEKRRGHAADDSESSQIQYSREAFEQDLRSYLSDQNYEDDQIKKVLERVRSYDMRILSDSFFASLGTGSIELDRVVNEMMSDEELRSGLESTVVSASSGTDQAQSDVSGVVDGLRSSGLNGGGGGGGLSDLIRRWPSISPRQQRLLLDLALQDLPDSTVAAVQQLLLDQS